MADAVTSQTLADGDKIAVIKLTNISDGTGESSVKKVDVSALATNSAGAACAHATINQIWYDIGGMRVALEWNATSNVVAAAKTAALTNDVDFIPYIGIEAGAAAAEAINVHYQSISRNVFE